MARLAPGEQLAKVDVLVELEPGHVSANPDDRSREFVCDDSSMLTCSPTAGGRVTIAITPPADRFLTLTSCSLPLASVSLPTRSMAETRSSVATLGSGRGNGRRQGHRRRLERSIAAAESLT